MMISTKQPPATRDFPDMTRNELETLLQDARESFDVARAKKIETDRTYVAAANQLNAVERMVAKMNQRERSARSHAAPPEIEPTRTTIGTMVIKRRP